MNMGELPRCEGCIAREGTIKALLDSMQQPMGELAQITEDMKRTKVGFEAQYAHLRKMNRVIFFWGALGFSAFWTMCFFLPTGRWSDLFSAFIWLACAALHLWKRPKED